MDGFVFRRDLLSASELRAFCIKSDLAGLKQLGIHLLLIAATGTLVSVSLNSWWKWPAYVIHGIALGFIFAPLHECIHNTAFRSRRMNTIIAAVAGLILLLPAKYFRLFHFAHHKHTNDEQNDPELAIAKPSTIYQYCLVMTGIPSYWIPQLKMLAAHAAGRVAAPFIPSSDRKSIIAEARWHVGLYLAAFGFSYVLGSAFLLHYWVVPLLFGMVLLRGFLLAEHAGCELSGNMLSNTRTTVSNSLFRFLSWNMLYHCEHHAFPSVPFHQLPALHVQMKKHVAHVETGYIVFHRSFVRSLN